MRTVKRGLRYNNMRGDDSDSPTARQNTHSGTRAWRGAGCVVFERRWQGQPKMERCYQIALWVVQNPVVFFFLLATFKDCNLGCISLCCSKLDFCKYPNFTVQVQQ